MPSTDIIRKIERTHIFSDEIIFEWSRYIIKRLSAHPWRNYYFVTVARRAVWWYTVPRPSVRDIIKRLSEDYYFWGTVTDDDENFAFFFFGLKGGFVILFFLFGHVDRIYTMPHPMKTIEKPRCVRFRYSDYVVLAVVLLRHQLLVLEKKNVSSFIKR